MIWMLGLTISLLRSSIQDSEASLRTLAKRYGVNQKTVIKWCRKQRPYGGNQRASVEDIPTGPKDAKSTVLSIEQEAIIVIFRLHTLLSPKCAAAFGIWTGGKTRSGGMAG
jgi:transposase